MFKIVKKYLNAFLYNRRRKKELNSLKFGLNENEYFLISYPKSGNTWLRIILSNLISEDKKLEIAFHNCGEFIPDSHIQGQRELIINKKSKFNRLPVRIVKSHDRFKSFFKKRKVIYIVRNGENVLISLYYYLKARNNNEIALESIHKNAGSHSYGPWNKHVLRWLYNSIYIVQYENLKKDPENEILNLCKYLSIKVNQEEIIRVIENSSFNRMKSLEEKYGYYNDTRVKSDKKISFVRKGSIVNNDDIDIPQRIKTELCQQYKKIRHRLKQIKANELEKQKRNL